MTKLTTEILKHLSARKDIWLDDAAAPDGSPEIRGVQLRRLKETSVVGGDGYHPFNKIEWVYVGQSFAIETEFQKSKNPLSKAQLAWRDAFENVAGLYIEARSLDDVTEVLGSKEPQPWKEFQERETRVSKILNQQ